MRRLLLHRRAPLCALLVGAPLAVGCADGADPADRVGRPPIDTLSHRVCTGRPLPLTHIDEVVPGPDGRLAIVGRRTAPSTVRAGVDVAAWVVIDLDPAEPERMRVIERADPTDRPTPVAWRAETLLVTVGGDRLAPMEGVDTLDPQVIEPPFGVPAVFDADTPHLATGGGRTFMVLGEPSPRGEPMRAFVEVERGDAAAGTVDRVVATYGTLRRDDFVIGFGAPIGSAIEAIGVTDWHIEPDGTLVAIGWLQVPGDPLEFFYVGHRTPVASDPEAGWFDEGALEAGVGALLVDSLSGRVIYDLRGDARGAAEIVWWHPLGGPATNGFAYSVARPWEGRVEYDTPPPFARSVRVTSVEAVGDDRVLGGAGCVDPPPEETLFEQPRCRAFVSRYVGETAEARWTVTVDVDAVDHVMYVQPIDGRLMVLAAAFDQPYGRGAALGDARLVMLDRDGRCLDE